MLSVTGAARPDFSSRIEFGCQNADEQFLAVASGFFGAALVPFDAPDLMQEADDAAGESFRVGDAVAGQAFAEIARLADIQDPLGGAAHQVHARHFGERAEEVLAEPLDERFGRVEKPELSGSHGLNSTSLDVNFQPLIIASSHGFGVFPDNENISFARGSLFVIVSCTFLCLYAYRYNSACLTACDRPA